MVRMLHIPRVSGSWICPTSLIGVSSRPSGDPAERPAPFDGAALLERERLFGGSIRRPPDPPTLPHKRPPFARFCSRSAFVFTSHGDTGRASSKVVPPFGT